MRDGHLCLAPVPQRDGVDRLRAGCVHAQQAAQRSCREAQRALARRPRTFEIAERRHNGRLVDRDPPRDHVAERLDARRHVARKARRRLGRGDTARCCEPRRQCEVMQRDDRFHAELAARAHDIGVVRQCFAVEAPRLGLDTRPLDRESMRGLMHRGELREVLAIPVVVIDRDGRVAAAGNRLGMRGRPARPVVVGAAFHLVRGGGAAEQEAVGQMARGQAPAAGASSVIARLAMQVDRRHGSRHQNTVRRRTQGGSAGPPPFREPSRTRP